MSDSRTMNTDVGALRPLFRSLDQELAALARGASLECLVCGEFVQHALGVIRCPECGASFSRAEARRGGTGVQLRLQAG